MDESWYQWRRLTCQMCTKNCIPSRSANAFWHYVMAVHSVWKLHITYRLYWSALPTSFNHLRFLLNYFDISQLPEDEQCFQDVWIVCVEKAGRYSVRLFWIQWMVHSLHVFYAVCIDWLLLFLNVQDADYCNQWSCSMGVCMSWVTLYSFGRWHHFNAAIATVL